MRSIRTKTILLILSAVLVSILAVGGMSILTIRDASGRMADREISMLCDNSRKTLNAYMSSIEQSVDIIARYSLESLSSVDLVDGGVVGLEGYGYGLAERRWNTLAQNRLDRYLKSYLNALEPVFRSVANHTNGVISFYLRLNPEITQDHPGFWLFKSGGSSFSNMELIRIQDYEQNDTGHVAWYYEPLRRGRPIWLLPYVNENLGRKMVSYVSPLYKASTFIGVAGMDIGYDTLARHVDEIRIYDTGYAFLSDDEGHVLYHPKISDPGSLNQSAPELDEAIRLSAGSGDAPALSTYTFGGVRRKAAAVTLVNGMKLIVSAPLAEINAASQRITRQILAVGGVLLAVFGLLGIFFMRRVIAPLQKLTAASRQLAEGNYDVKLDYSGNDEVGTLTSSFQALIDHLKIYIDDLNIRMYKDALTGVRNKGGFDLYTQRINDRIRSSPNQPPQFAVVMLDCNDLKHINDLYGHIFGDIYLKTACRLICSVFAESPVFRVGGDEFVAVLQDDDYERRDELMQEFDARAEKINGAEPNPWERISLAKGLTVYDPHTDSGLESVLRRADKAMYEDKARMKLGRA